MIRASVLAAFLVVLAAAAGAGDIAVESPWSRATPGKAPNGAVYLTLVNRGSVPDRLIAVATPVAERAQMHAHTMDNGVMKMRRLDAIEVAPGSPTVLAPGGLHVMLFKVDHPLEEGMRFPLTLTFEHAGSLTVEVEVHKIGAMGPDGGDHRRGS